MIRHRAIVARRYLELEDLERWVAYHFATTPGQSIRLPRVLTMEESELATTFIAKNI